jgi:hypothetical protein
MVNLLSVAGIDNLRHDLRVNRAVMKELRGLDSPRHWIASEIFVFDDQTVFGLVAPFAEEIAIFPSSTEGISAECLRGVGCTVADHEFKARDNGREKLAVLDETRDIARVNVVKVVILGECHSPLTGKLTAAIELGAVKLAITEPMTEVRLQNSDQEMMAASRPTDAGNIAQCWSPYFANQATGS